MSRLRSVALRVVPWAIALALVVAVTGSALSRVITLPIGVAAILGAALVERELARAHAPWVPGCSFCGRARAEVRYLVAGPRVAICDACVKLSSDILEQAQVPGAAPLEPHAGPRDPWRPPEG